jgi:poly-gamma-glutamate capsule biosynthesis protein CapA/YwtB (metallophosphatase superfamily)
MFLACVSMCAAGALAQQAPRPRSAQPRSGQRADYVTIVAGGDILLHIKVNKAAARHGWTRLFESLRDELPEEHIAFANLETPLVDDVSEVVTGSPPVLGSRLEAAGALSHAGFDVLACANNHAYDQRSSGAARTVARVREEGMESVGAEAEEAALWEPRIVTRGDMRVAFLSVTDGINRGPGRPILVHIASMSEEEKLIEAIGNARTLADVVVLAVHWSYDYAPGVSHRQRRRAHRWVEAGVDFVVGTGPHVLHPVERLQSSRGDALIAYSLGNLISNQGQRWEPGRRISRAAHTAVRIPDTRDGILLRATFVKEGEQLRLQPIVGVPLFTENNFWTWWRSRSEGHDIRVIPLRDAALDVQQSRFPAIRAALGPSVEVLGEPRDTGELGSSEVP